MACLRNPGARASSQLSVVLCAMKMADSGHLPAVIELLHASGLPTDDVGELDLSLFLVEESSDLLEAVGGLERCGDSALLRSVATAEVSRGRGLAAKIIQELERIAARSGTQELYLLTESATGYFEALGYVTRSREELPQSIRESRQFTSLCPDSATVMSKRIGA